MDKSLETSQTGLAISTRTMPSRAQMVLTQNIVHTTTMDDFKSSDGDEQEFCASKNDNIKTSHHYTNQSHTGTDDELKFLKTWALTKIFKITRDD